MKKLSIIYAIFLLIVIPLNLFFHFNKQFREQFISTLFSWHKAPVKADAQVIGYSFKAHKSKNSSATFSYDYGICYTYDHKNYFGRYTVAQNEKANYTDYYPLPVTIPIILNRNKPEQFIYTQTHYGGQGFMIILFQLIFLSGAVMVLYHRKQFTTPIFLEEIKASYKKDKLKTSISLIVFPLIILLPLLFTCSTLYQLYHGSLAENVTGYKLLCKNPPPAAEIQELKQSGRSSNDFLYLNVDLYHLDKLNNIATISNFNDLSVKKCFILTPKKEVIDLRFQYRNNDLEIFLEQKLKQCNYNVYLIADTQRYLIPLDMLQYDIQYK